jgi:hypothetical protein
MCWIAITKYEDLAETLERQNDRGLDSIWIINKKNIQKATKEDLDWYLDFIKNKVEKVDWLNILHHRKATVWAINIDNAHPFIWDKFILIQNWTIKSFNNSQKDTYWAEVDSHNLLHLIEENAETINEIPIIMEAFKEEYKDSYWIVIVLDYIWNILFISDWARESYIDIKDNKINFIWNYSKDLAWWYINKWYLIFNFDWDIIENWFKEELNKELFTKPVVYQQPNQYNFNYYDDIYMGYWRNNIHNTHKIKKKEKKKDDLLTLFWGWVADNRYLCNVLWFNWTLTDFLDENFWVETVWEYNLYYKEKVPFWKMEELFNKILNYNKLIW